MQNQQTQRPSAAQATEAPVAVARAAKVPGRTIFGYGSASFGANLIYFMVSSFLMYFYTDLLGVSPAVIGVIFLVARIWDAINDILMGTIVDRTHTKWGRFRPFILFGGIASAVATVLCFFPVSAPPAVTIAYICVSYILWGMAYTAFDIPYYSLMPALTNSASGRTRLSATHRLAGYASSMIAGVVFIPLIRLLDGENEKMGYFFVALVFAALFIICAVVCFKNTSESTIATRAQSEKITFRRATRMLLSNRPLLLIIVPTLLTGISTSIRSGTMIYFIKYNLGDELLVSAFNLSLAVCALLGVAVTALLSARIDKKPMMLVAALVSVGATLLSYVANTNVTLLLVANSLMALGAGVSMVLGTSLAADTVEYGHWKTGVRAEGIIFSVNTFAVKVTMALSGVLLGFIMTALNFTPNTAQAPEMLDWFRILFSLFPAVGSVIGIIPLILFPLTREKFQKIVTEIENGRVGDACVPIEGVK